MEKYPQDLKDSLKHLKIADHMIYITFPLIKEKRLLIKIFDEIYKSVFYCINAVLDYENLQINIEKQNNFKIIADRYLKEYFSNEEIREITKILSLSKQHKGSAMEFVKGENFVIMSDSLNTKTLDLEKVKKYLIFTKNILMKANLRLKKAKNP